MPSLRVRSEVFLREDIESVLRALDMANRRLAPRAPDASAEEFGAGFRAALEAVAVAFHADLADGELTVGARLAIALGSALPARAESTSGERPGW